MASLGVSAGEGFPVVMPGAGLTSCKPLLSLLQEDDAKLKYGALQKMVRDSPNVRGSCATEPGVRRSLMTSLPSGSAPLLFGAFSSPPGTVPLLFGAPPSSSPPGTIPFLFEALPCPSLLGVALLLFGAFPPGVPVLLQ